MTAEAAISGISVNPQCNIQTGQVGWVRIEGYEHGYGQTYPQTPSSKVLHQNNHLYNIEVVFDIIIIEQ